MKFDMFVSIYRWNNGDTFGVVWRDGCERHRDQVRYRLETLGKTVLVGTEKCSGKTAVEQGWRKNLVKTPAMLALGVSAV